MGFINHEADVSRQVVAKAEDGCRAFIGRLQNVVEKGDRRHGSLQHFSDPLPVASRLTHGCVPLVFVLQ